MELVPDTPNVELRLRRDGHRVIVMTFPYDAALVAAVRAIPGRSFDWDTKEWSAPIDDWVGLHVADMLQRFPDLRPAPEVETWLERIAERWIATVTTTKHDGHGWFVLKTRAGPIPEEVADRTITTPDGLMLASMTRQVAIAIEEQRAVRMDRAAQRCVETLLSDADPPPARLALSESVEGDRLKLDVLWDASLGEKFSQLPGAQDGRGLPLDPWNADHLDAFLKEHNIPVVGAAVTAVHDLREEHQAAAEAVARSRATEADPIPEVAAKLGGELQPFQWAGVRYALDARRCFVSDEQGLGKTVQALAALEAADAYPAVVVCPASLKLNWERETRKWLPHRSVGVLEGRGASSPKDDITILNYEIVAAHRRTLTAMGPKALIVDESHYCKNPQAKRTHAVRRLAEGVTSDGLRLALSGTPVLNHAEELVSQLRVLGRIEEFGSGARFARQFGGELSEERLHWHLRRRCFVRRLKSEVLPQLPAKRRVVVSMPLDNEREYRLAEQSVIEWLREQPLDLAELDAKIARTLRAERLAQLGTLQRLSAKGKLEASMAWIHDFLASGEPLVVFARHREIQEALIERFPEAAHLLGRDSVDARDKAVRGFQEPDGPQLIICATRVAAQGITLTRASNVAFLELEWTPALHDQAEDRVHRIGQEDSVTAWYLLAARTIDETMSELLERKREIVAAVTDGQVASEERTVLGGVLRELRDGEPYRHLRPVA
ncbi:MAG: hypothetical protein JHC95_13165 [Solirubrobacteraceae bacterium]|nr:hypothetical protein [Solirubrobacteraceae bacterium]